MASNVEGIVI
jgi:hypothetical protein